MKMYCDPSCPVIGGCWSFSMAVMRSFSMGGMAGCGWVFVRILVSLLVVMVIWCCRRSAFRVAWVPVMVIVCCRWFVILPAWSTMMVLLVLRVVRYQSWVCIPVMFAVMHCIACGGFCSSHRVVSNWCGPRSSRALACGVVHHPCSIGGVYRIMVITMGFPARCRLSLRAFRVGWYLKVWATMSLRSCFLASSIMCLHSWVVRAMGFSTRICFWALVASMAMGACRLLGVVMITASMSFLLSSWW